MNNFLNLVNSYTLSVITIAILTLVWGLYKIRSIKQERLRSAKHMDIGAAVDTGLHDEVTENLLRRRAISSIEDRFNFVNKLFIPLVMFIAIAFIIIPVLPNMSASYVSLTVAILAALSALAAKPVIENAIAGIVITLSQPIRLNDTVVIDGKYGTVEKINALYTVVKIWNWRRYIIPNYKLLQKEFENLSRSDEYEWAHVEYYVAPNSNVDLVKTLSKKAMNTSTLWKHEPPSFWIMDMNKDSIKCWIAGWAQNPADAWALKAQTRQNLMQLFNENNIEYQRVVVTDSKFPLHESSI